jgi:putative hydrolase of the HAD superfamily
MRQECRLSGTDEQIGLAFADMFDPNPDVCSVIPRLRGRYRMLLLSNTNELHYQQFARQFADTLSHFDALALSFQLGVRKPHPQIYARCRELAGNPAAAECLFIDDLPANIAAARAAGWQGLVYRRGDNLSAHLAEMGIDLGKEANHE